MKTGKKILTGALIAASIMIIQGGANVSGVTSFGVSNSIANPHNSGDHSTAYIYDPTASGTTYQANLIVTNVTTNPSTAFVAPSPAQNTSNGWVFGVQTDGGHTDWVSIVSQNYVVPPQSSISIPYQVTVPAGLPTGDYYIGLEAMTMDNFNDPPPAGTGAIVHVRGVMPIKVNVGTGGYIAMNVDKVGLVSTDWRGYSQFNFTVTNTANRLWPTYTPKASITITDPNGVVLVNRSFGIAAALPFEPGCNWNVLQSALITKGVSYRVQFTVVWANGHPAYTMDSQLIAA